MTYDSRIVKRKGKDEEWEIIPFENLRHGDIFMLFEPDGKGPILNNAGEAELQCTNNAYLTTNKKLGCPVWIVEIL